MKKQGLLMSAVILGILLVLSVGNASAYVLHSTQVYSLYYKPAASWVQVYPNDTPSYDANTLWKYSYNVINHPDSTTDIHWMHVFYGEDLGYMSNMTQTGIPTGWDDYDGTNGTPTGLYPTKIQWGSDNIATYYIAPGSNLSGFEYTFKWSNLQSIPGSQHYEAGNGISESGSTIPVPEPASLSLLGLSLLGLGGMFRRKFMS